jgi:hypothetical protein
VEEEEEEEALFDAGGWLCSAARRIFDTSHCLLNCPLLAIIQVPRCKAVAT